MQNPQQACVLLKLMSLSELTTQASKQHGLMTHKQATDAGFSRTAISRLVRKGEWQQVRPRVFRKAATKQTEAQDLLALCLWLGESAVVSHRSAARLLGLDIKQGDLEVTVGPRFSGELPGVIVHRSKSLPKDDKRLVRGIPVTTAARTIIDLASCLDEEPLAIAVEEAWRRGIATPQWVEKRLTELSTQGRHSGALAEILADRRQTKAPLESALEVRMWRVLRGSKLPMPIAGYEFRDDYGQPGRIDLAYPDQQLALECESWEFHGDREAFETDRVRAARLVALGWRVMPITWRQLDEQRGKVLNRIREALAFRTEKIAR